MTQTWYIVLKRDYKNINKSLIYHMCTDRIDAESYFFDVLNEDREAGLNTINGIVLELGKISDDAMLPFSCIWDESEFKDNGELLSAALKKYTANGKYKIIRQEFYGNGRITL